MSIDQPHAFLKLVNENESVPQQIQADLAEGSLHSLKLVAEHGFAVGLRKHYS